ncbi:AAA family ATPase [Vibrio parahaemolyticus]|uniref:AAA family ATPase n=1 Tax=Vibrio parahaemolyticus TaxID=670 RepID=UPI0011245B32|nr:AAA family ATPase [Vibrio parahaemolyticus]TOI35018.1 AAA family ATPase [Vibrio parahaemolyticus]HCE2112282.1 AAA family ATPase [Vibrio parahaemolyticus]HCE2390262.1 AAA family ATPase [Vibrio parahaemolyticus]HCG6999890.1 AAA family ATPase [Vibrio parahaemolyticus]HCG7010328.1 AAA family ATPase [Vibrio parahaemolyticus]
MKISRFNIRVTSVWNTKDEIITFCGVPLKGSKRASAKKVIVVKANIKLLPMLPVRGQHWRISGTKTEGQVQRGGFIQTQVDVQATRLRVTMPETGDNFVEFVASDKEFVGVGDVYARKLWDKFQTGIYKILESGDVEMLEMVLTTKTAQTMVEAWKKYSNLKHLHWFAEHAVPPSISSNIMKYHDERAIELVKANPYILQSFGMDFSAVDEMVKSHFQIAESDSRRLVAAVEESLYRFTKKGHTVASHSDLKTILNRVLDCSELAKQAMMTSHENGDFILDDDGNYHPTAALVMEKVVAHRFLHLAGQNETWDGRFDEALAHGMENLAFPLLERQVDAVCSSLLNPISVLTGGAGTGKTTVLRVILRAYQKLGYKIYPMALAGRAAKRIKEGTGFHASTIAGFLKNVEISDDEQAIIVIDEASMVDLHTMYRLVMALHCNVRILLVGDPAQLSPIGYGLILHDVVKTSSIAGTELNIVKRQKGSTGIPEFTLAVRNGQVPTFTSPNIRFHFAQPESLNQKITELYAQDPSNTQIVGATYSANHGGINTLNNLCQEQCNPTGERLEFDLFGDRMYLNIRVNDPIIFTENEWDNDIQNGTMGRLVSTGEEFQFGMVELDDGRTVELTESLINIVQPAYAVSLHKAQGSQFPRVIVALTGSRMIDRSWIYTALTRAETHIEIVGTPQQFEDAIRRTSAAEQRKTTLHRLLAA